MSFRLLALLALTLSLPPLTLASEEVVVIGHASVKPMSRQTVEKIYMGKNLQVGDMFVIAVNARPRSPTRERFLQVFIGRTEDQYHARWIVMRSVGLGLPPREFDSPAQIIDFVTRTPGAIGYVDASQVRVGMNVVAR